MPLWSTWAKNNWVTANKPGAADMNDLGNSIREWGGTVNANGNHLTTLWSAVAQIGPNYGQCVLHSGDLTNAGFIEFRKPNTTRLGYMGWGTGNDLSVVPETGLFLVAGQLKVNDGASNACIYYANNVFLRTGTQASPVDRVQVDSAGAVNCLSGNLWLTNSGGTNLLFDTPQYSSIVKNLYYGGSPAGWRHKTTGYSMLQVINPSGYISIILATGAADDLMDLTNEFLIGPNGFFKIALLPTTNPGAGTKRFWADSADSYRVKWAN